MSKNQSRKGYVVGALVALVSTLFTVAPAQADANGPVTLLPTDGTTFNSIIGSPVAVQSSLDPASVVTVATAMDAAFYVIDNPDNASIDITYVTAPDDGTAGGSDFRFMTYDDTTGLAVDVYSESDSVTGVAFAGSVSSASFTITTTVSKIAVSAETTTSSFAAIKIDSNEDTTTTVTVQTLIDITGTGTARGLATAPTDRVSAVETVNLYAPGSVAATSTILALGVNASASSTSFKATVVYGSSVNPWFVQGRTAIGFFKNGSAFNVSSGPTASLGITTSTTTAGGGITKNVLTAGVNPDTGAYDETFSAAVGAGVYSAQAYYQTAAGTWVTVGAASAIWDASAGPSSLVSTVYPTFVDSLDAAYSSSDARSTSEVLARSGTKTITIGAQLYSTSTVSLAASNVEIKAVVGGSLDATTTITVTGASGTLVKGGSALTAFARTDTSGKASFTITSTTGKKGDAVSVTLYAKKSDGSWADMTQTFANSDVDVVWEDAEFSAFTAKPATYISGANPTVTFKVADQWGKGISTIDGKALTVYTVASFGGVENAKSYSGTVVVANGEAKFTFANFAPAGGLAQLKASLFQGAIGTSVNKLDEETVNVYNTAATDKVAVVDSFATAITYKDYVTGDTTDPVVAKAVSDAKLSTADGKEITGNVLNTAAVGQPGVAVTVAAKGVLFYADGVYALDTITTNANEFGAFSVYAFAHTVNVKGATVSITADGKTANTLLVTYLPDSLADENLKFSWTLPATVVKNTTYAVTLSLTDKWGNPVAGSTTSTNGAVSVQGLGSVQINSVDTAVNRNFDKNGQTTVFLRSVKDIAGPGSIVATLRTSGWTYPTGATGTDATLGSIGSFNTSNDKSTAWDETLWSNELTSAIEVLDTAPASAGKVNVGSFNGKLVVYAANLNGARISWKVGGNWGSAVATSNYSIFNRPTPRAGVTVSVEVFVNGVKTLTKSVVTR